MGFFKNLFGKEKSHEPNNQPNELNNKPNDYDTITIYEDYKAAIESMLVSWGFNISKGDGAISGVTKYKRNELEVILSYDMRDPGVYLNALSGKNIPAKSRIEEMEQLLGKKLTNHDDAINMLVNQSDISEALNGSDEEKNKIIQEIKDWYLENSQTIT